MSALYDFFLTGMLAYGPSLYGVGIFIGALGAPLPVSLLVLAAGAFARQELFDWRLAAGLGVAAACLGDAGAFLAGRLFLPAIERRWGRREAWQRALLAFNRKATLAVFLSRFWLTPLALPVNLIAGGRCSYARFLPADLLGETLWVGIYGTLGYIFGGQWELVGDLASNFSYLSVGAVLAGLGLYFWLRRRKPGPRDGWGRQPARGGPPRSGLAALQVVEVAEGLPEGGGEGQAKDRQGGPGEIIQG